MKQKVIDTLVLTTALIFMIVVAMTLTSLSIYLRVLSGLIAGLIILISYYFIRKPDEVITLEEKLNNIANNASEISKISRLVNDQYLRRNLEQVSFRIAKIGMRIMRRELPGVKTEINRLESLSSNFLEVLRVFDDTYVGDELEEGKADMLRNKGLKDVESVLDSIEKSIDRSRARKLLEAEKELILLTTLYRSNDKAFQAAQILTNLARRSESRGK